MEYRDVCFEIESDEFYKQFLNDKHSISEELNTADKVEKLSKGIEKLNSELEAQVLSKHHDLLTQASHATNLEKAIDSMHIDAQSLLTGIERLRSQVHIPYNMLESQTMILGRVQSVCHLMRHALKVIQLCVTLKNLSEEPLAQASVLYEVELYLQENDFTGICFMEEYLMFTKSIKMQLIEDASQKLMKGLANANRNLLLSSFQAFNNLHCAKERIDNIVMAVLQKTRQATLAAFVIKNDPKKQGDASKSGPGKANFVNMQTYKVKFWENMEKLFTENYYSSCKEILLLQNALNDLNSLENYNNVAKLFWEQLSSMFSSELKKCTGYANQCVEIDYPKLLKCFNDLCGKLNHKDIIVQRELLSQWENYFLSKSLEKLLDPVRNMWTSNQVPSSDDVDSVVRIISNILSVSLGDRQLSLSLAMSIAKCVKQMSREAEEKVCLENEAGQIIEAPSSSQQLNANISNILYYFSTQITRVLNNMSNVLHPDTVMTIQDSLKEMSSVAVLQPFCVSINNSLDLIIGSMNGEADLNRNDSPEGQDISHSLYLRELESFITRCKDIYLSMYHDNGAVMKCCEEIATHCIKTFVRNVCSLRPVSAYGRAKLQIDCKYMEVALHTLVNDLSVIECYRELRALHTLLGMTPLEIFESQSKGGSLSNSLVMMLLFAHAEPKLVSPHQCAGWTQQKLLEWLSHSNEEERLNFIAGALQRYQTHIRQNNISKYDDVYPILIQLLERGKVQE